MNTFTVNVGHPISFPSGNVHLQGILHVPADAIGIVLFAHGSGSGRFSTRNQFVAQELNSAKIATFLFDLLTEAEEKIDDQTLELRFDIEFLSNRLQDAAQWIKKQPSLSKLNIGYFGASTGGGAALMAAAAQPTLVKAVVSRGGRPDLAGDALQSVQAPTLLIVGGNDDVVIELNKQALAQLNCAKKLEIVPGATHLFEEPGTLNQVADLAKQWFQQYLMI